MRKNRYLLVSMMAGCLLGSTAACGDSSEPATPDDGVGGSGGNNDPLKLATWWAVGSEQESLQRVITEFRADNPGANVELVAAVNAPDPRRELYHTIEWDVAQESGQDLVENVRDIAVDLNSVPELASTLANIDRVFLDLVTVDNQVIGLPMALHRENTLHYASEVVANPPETLADLRGMCESYLSGGSTGPKPLALGEPVADNEWILRILLEAMLPGEVLAGTAADPLPAFTAALEVIDYYAANECFHFAARWEQAAHALIDDASMGGRQAAMFIHGDWAKGYLIQNGEQAGVDFGVTTTPGANGAYYFNLDTLAVRAASPRRDLAIQFMVTALSAEGQIAFSEIKGSTPAVHIDNPETQMSDPALRATYQELVDAQAGERFIAVPVWVGPSGALLRPLFDRTRTVAEVAQDLIGIYPTGS